MTFIIPHIYLPAIPKKIKTLKPHSVANSTDFNFASNININDSINRIALARSIDFVLIKAYQT
jgi:hypothetical protein